jgi:prepilin-type N-terminal cleavage/methylation domain-containing protein
MRKPGGFTLIELLVVIMIVAVVIAIAQPSFKETIERRRIEGAGTELSTDLQYARSLAATRNTSVDLTTNNAGTGYTIAESSGGTTHRTVTLADSLSITANTTITYESVRGTSNAANLTISSSLSTDSIRVSTNVMGRVQMCIPSGNLPGFSSC